MQLLPEIWKDLRLLVILLWELLTNLQILLTFHLSPCVRSLIIKVACGSLPERHNPLRDRNAKK